MPSLTAQKICEIVGGKLVRGEAGTVIRGFMTRCTGVKPGMLYFDVKGGRGGDRNIVEAVQNGAVALVVSKYKRVLPEEIGPKMVVIAVPKVGEAFWQVIRYYRDQFPIPVIGVTGTSGKTTTKEMVTSIFRQKWTVLKTVGNQNLPPFVPTHILRLHKGHQAAVFEIGMNRPGQIRKQTLILKPQVGIITCIGPGHLEYVGSLENVIKEKASIMEGIPKGGFLLLNADDPSSVRIDMTGFQGRVIYFALQKPADYMARNIRLTPHGTWFTVMLDGSDQEFFIPTFGRHNVSNALAAIATARIYKFDTQTIRRGLALYRRPSMRLQVVKGIRNSILLNDTYNANPTSMVAGLEVLSDLAKGKPKIAVLGNMLEQGSFARENHKQVGEAAAKMNIDWLVTVGALAKEIKNGAALNPGRMKAWSFLLKNQAVEFLKKNMPDGAVVLVKGSRGAYMDRIVNRLRQN